MSFLEFTLLSESSVIQGSLGSNFIHVSLYLLLILSMFSVKFSFKCEYI